MKLRNLSLLLLSCGLLFSCGGPGDSSSPIDDDISIPIVFENITFNIDSNFYNNESINSIYYWNSDGTSYMIKDALTNFKTYNENNYDLTQVLFELDKEYTVCSEWSCKDEQTVTINKDSFSLMNGLLFRSVDGSSQTADLGKFSIENLEKTGGDIYYVNGQAYYDINSLPAKAPKPQIPDIATYKFYYYAEDQNKLLDMNEVYLYSFDTKTTATIKPEFKFKEIKFGEKSLKFSYFELSFNIVYNGNEGWGIKDSTSTIQITPEHLTGALLYKNTKGDFKTSDIFLDFTKLAKLNTGEVFYMDKDSYSWKSNSEKVYELGDLFYSKEEVATSLLAGEIK